LLVPLQFFGDRECFPSILTLPREVADTRSIFGNPPVLLPGDICSRYMDELRLQQLCKINEVLSAVNVGLDGLIDGRIEIDYAGKVHDDVDFLFDLLELIGRNSTQRLIEIAFDNLDLLPDGTLPNTSDNRAQRRRLQHVRIESLLR